MPTYRFAALLWQDCVGTYTMVPVEAPNQSWAGHGSSPRRARESLRDLLTWLDCRNELPEPELLEASLHTYRVPVRPEYAARNRIYPCAEVWVPVPCVSGKTATDLRVAALPLLGVRFYYHEPGELKSLVIRYTQQQLKGQTPAQIAGYLPPRQLRLAEVVVRSRKRGTPPRPLDERWPALSQVAEPLGERAVRKQFAPAWERGALVQEVVRKLHHERASLVLVGEQGVGKSTVLVEAVQAVERLQAAEAKQRGNSAERTFWLTTGSRLIAGMKYLGQWEERCESIIDELARLPGVLCVDRLLELVRLGGVGPADSIAAFLVPYLRRGELRLVGEATPAELDACRRLLPEFADLLAILPVPAFDQAAALTVLDRSAERYAQNLRLEVAPGVSERTYRLFRRFQPYRALPGGAVHFLRDLCARLARERPPVSVTPASVVRHFVRRTGLPEWLLDDETPLDAATLKDDLRRQVIGQEEAVEAAARVVLTFKAGMHDPQRPLGVLLFCGPTGVGKTELARTLARVLFGHGEALHGTSSPDDDRLVRLDMSEYAGFDAVERLLGPPHGEPGVLVRRVRRQPFCVLLLDEIEKASPEVFDALLGVCDEGRLTDRFGRTTTFRGSVIIMTSNLGAAQRESFGLVRGAQPDYTAVARDFFRPEFFNRLDGVVHFQPLNAVTIDAIARKELHEIAQREAFRRAGLRLTWSDALVGLLAREGFDARFGARPLQRVLEKRVVAPLARFLLKHPQLRDRTLHLELQGDGAIEICL